MASDAVGLELVSKVVGYKIEKGDFSTASPNLPQRIAILGEVNTANQAGVDPETPIEITSAKQAGDLFGFGSPIHMMMRILRPNSGSGVAGIPTIVFPQLEADGATEKVFEITPVGVATATVTHTLKVSGRTSVDGTAYDFVVSTGDSTGEITAKIEDAINNVLGCPFSAVSTDYEATATSKWKGLTANDLLISIDTNGNDAGINYSVTSIQDGAGTPSIAASLQLFGNDWNTIVLNPYGIVTSVVDALEDFNGIPSDTPTGRYSGIVFKPFFALTGTTEENGETVFTDSKKTEVTIVMCPAPLSEGHPMEASANYGLALSRQAQDTPHLDISGKYLNDMPTPLAIGYMSSYINRDAVVKKGHSTVELVNGLYKVCDFVTTYHPDGETPPQFRYVRSLVQDFNMRFRYFLLEQTYVVDKAIASNETTVSASNVIKPMQWVQVLSRMFDNAALDGLIVEPDFSKESLVVNIGSSNPDRFETSFSYKRSGFTRIASTTAKAGFNFNS